MGPSLGRAKERYGLFSKATCLMSPSGSWGVGFLERDRRSLARGGFLCHSCQLGNESN